MPDFFNTVYTNLLIILGLVLMLCSMAGAATVISLGLEAINDKFGFIPAILSCISILIYPLACVLCNRKQENPCLSDH